MGKTICLILSFVLVLFTRVSQATPTENILGPTFPLPAPQGLHFVSVTPGSLSVAWSASQDAAIYRVTIFDQTDQITMAPIYTSATSVSLDGMNTQTHSYTIGVSASACTDPPVFGAESQIGYQPGIIIIVDEIVQLNGNCQPPSGNGSGFSAGQTVDIQLPVNSSNFDNLNAERIRISTSNLPNTPSVEFLLWSDCYQQTRFMQIVAKGAKRTVSGNNIRYSAGNNGEMPFFDIINGNCDIGICHVTLKVFVTTTSINAGSCSIPNEEWSCGNKANNGNGNVHREVSDTAPDTPAKVTLHPQRTGSSTVAPVGSMKVAPNPFTDRLRVQYTLEEAGTAGVQLFNATGALVQEIATPEWREAGIYDTEVSLTDALPHGIYFIVLQTAGKRTALPVVKE